MTEPKEISRQEYIVPNVPKMSLPTKSLSRLPKIKQGLRQGLNRNEIAVSCQVDEKTIDRDIKSWTESGNFEQWLKEEFLTLHAQICDDDPVEAYRQITQLVKTTITRKIEKQQDIRIEVIAPWRNKQQFKNPLQPTTIDPTLDKQNSTNQT